jgi:hypothetical protein
MAQQEVTMPWAKAHGWRVVRPTGVSVFGVGSGEGFSYQIHFTTNFLEIEAEKFQAETDLSTGSVKQTGASSFLQHPSRIEEVSLVLPAMLAADIVALLLASFPQMPDSSKKIIRDAIAKLPKNK